MPNTTEYSLCKGVGASNIKLYALLCYPMSYHCHELHNMYFMSCHLEKTAFHIIRLIIFLLQIHEVFAQKDTPQMSINF